MESIKYDLRGRSVSSIRYESNGETASLPIPEGATSLKTLASPYQESLLVEYAFRGSCNTLKYDSSIWPQDAFDSFIVACDRDLKRLR